MKIPPTLKKGDQIAILASASAVKKENILMAKQMMEERGFEVKLGKYLESETCYFPCSDEEKLAELQQALDNEQIRAIFFARGGYGSVRLIDQIDFTKFKTKPKWLVGFSDITVYHMHAFAKLNVATVHAPMPNSFHATPKEVLEKVFTLLQGNEMNYDIPSNPNNREGKAEGKLIGGNLSILNSLLGSASFPNLKNTILFMEEVGEYLYHIDRMLHALKRAGHLAKLNGILVGSFTEIKDTNPPFGCSLEDIILNIVKEYNYPVVFDFPAGHINNNNPLAFGKEVILEADEKKVLLSN